MSCSVTALGISNHFKLPDGGHYGAKTPSYHAAQTAYLQLCFSVFIAERIIGPSPVGVRVAKPLTILSAVFSGLFWEETNTSNYRLLGIFHSESKEKVGVWTCGVKVHKVVWAVLGRVGARWRVIPAQPSIPVAAAVGACSGTQLNTENRGTVKDSSSYGAYLSCCTLDVGSFSQSICTGCPGFSSEPFPAPPGSPWDWPWPRQKSPPPGPPRTERLPNSKCQHTKMWCYLYTCYLRTLVGSIYFGLILLVLLDFIAAFIARLAILLPPFKGSYLLLVLLLE